MATLDDLDEVLQCVRDAVTAAAAASLVDDFAQRQLARHPGDPLVRELAASAGTAAHEAVTGVGAAAERLARYYRCRRDTDSGSKTG